MKICSLRNENPLENADFKFSVNNGRNNWAEGTSLSTAKATPTTRDRGTERNRRFLSLPVSPPIYRSKSAKFQLCITARRIILFSSELHRAIFVLCFFLFLNPDAEIMLNLLFNTLLTITPHNTQKRRRRKERTTYDCVVILFFSKHQNSVYLYSSMIRFVFIRGCFVERTNWNL